VAFAQLPDAASLDRTDAVISAHVRNRPEAAGRAGCGGISWAEYQRIQCAPNAGIVFFGLKPFDERKDCQSERTGIAAALNQQFASIQDAFILAVPRRP